MTVTRTLQEQLQHSLGDAYRIERELGGGGMSRVFVALEMSLERQVVVKVLLPELAGGVSVERFRREIHLAAQLQHPHIVPLLSAGESRGCRTSPCRSWTASRCARGSCASASCR